MRRRLMVACAAGGIAALAAATALGWWLAHPEHGDWQERRLVFQIEARNETSSLQKDVELRAFVPPDIPQRQQRLEVSARQPLDIRQAPGGNRLAVVELGEIAPYAAQTVRMEIRLRVRERVAVVDDVDDRPGSGNDVRFPVAHEAIGRAAQRFDKREGVGRLRSIHQWVAQHVDEAGYVARDRGALYALREQRGDCTEFMSLTSALALHAGMRVRSVGGFPYDEDRVARPAHFHNWAEVASDGRWWVVDPQEEVFTQRTDGHVIVRRLSSEKTTGVGSQGIVLPIDGFDVRML